MLGADPFELPVCNVDCGLDSRNLCTARPTGGALIDGIVTGFLIFSMYLKSWNKLISFKLQDKKSILSMSMLAETYNVY